MYATAEDVQSGFRNLTNEELENAESLLREAAVLIDSAARDADDDVKALVSCRMVRRALGAGVDAFPLGSTQGTVSAGPYSQTFTIGSGGSVGELYLSRVEKNLLGVGNRIGAHSPLEDIT